MEWRYFLRRFWRLRTKCTNSWNGAGGHSQWLGKWGYRIGTKITRDAIYVKHSIIRLKSVYIYIRWTFMYYLNVCISILNYVLNKPNAKLCLAPGSLSGNFNIFCFCRIYEIFWFQTVQKIKTYTCDMISQGISMNWPCSLCDTVSNAASCRIGVSKIL